MDGRFVANQKNLLSHLRMSDKKILRDIQNNYPLFQTQIIFLIKENPFFHIKQILRESERTMGGTTNLCQYKHSKIQSTCYNTVFAFSLQRKSKFYCLFVLFFSQ